MDFKQLESFVSIAKLKSFSKAAKKQFLTQPTLSNHIQALEAELGTVLFNRSNKNITLTQAGDVLYEYAISILNKKENAYFALDVFKGKIDGILEIASSSIPEKYFLVEKITLFNQIYPDVKYILMKYDTKAVIDQLLAGEVNFGLVGAKIESPHLDYSEIFDDELILVMSKTLFEKFNFAHHYTTWIYDLPFILREAGSGTREMIERRLREFDIDNAKLTVRAEIEDNETTKQFLINGLGAAVISKSAVEKELSAGTLVAATDTFLSIHRKFYFVYHKKRVLSPLEDTFRQFIEDHTK